MKKSKKREEDILYIAVHGREQGRHRYVGYQYYTYIELDGQIATWIAIQFSSAFYVTGMCATSRSAQSPFLTPLQFYTHFLIKHGGNRRLSRKGYIGGACSIHRKGRVAHLDVHQQDSI